MKAQKVSIDKIVAVESTLEIIELLQDFCFENIIVLQRNNNTKTKNNVLSLYGYEDSGIITLASLDLSIEIQLTHIVEIRHTWQNNNVYQIDIKETDGTLTVLFRMSNDTIPVDMID